MVAGSSLGLSISLKKLLMKKYITNIEKSLTALKNKSKHLTVNLDSCDSTYKITKHFNHVIMDIIFLGFCLHCFQSILF